MQVECRSTPHVHTLRMWTYHAASCHPTSSLEGHEHFDSELGKVRMGDNGLGGFVEDGLGMWL